MKVFNTPCQHETYNTSKKSNKLAWHKFHVLFLTCLFLGIPYYAVRESCPGSNAHGHFLWITIFWLQKICVTQFGSRTLFPVYRPGIGWSVYNYPRLWRFKVIDICEFQDSRGTSRNAGNIALTIKYVTSQRCRETTPTLFFGNGWVTRIELETGRLVKLMRNKRHFANTHFLHLSKDIRVC